MSDSNPYTSRKINTLAPTDGIADPQVRAFCDSLANVWQLRNGNTGFDDSERFITKQEWDFIAKNPNIRALAGIGQPGASTLEPGPTGSTGQGNLPPWVQNLADFLSSGITLVDFAAVRRTGNELFASIYALTTQVRDQIGNIDAELAKLQHGINEINNVVESSTSPSATHLWALNEQVNDKDTGLPVATAAYLEIEKVEVNQVTKSANAKRTQALTAIVDDPTHGNLRNRADIIQINTVDATSTSANASRLQGLSASVGYDKTTGKAKVTGDIASLETLELDSASANARETKGMMVSFADEHTTKFAAINAINTVDVNSTSANARALSGVQAMVGFKNRIFVQANPPPSPTSDKYVLRAGDIWLDTKNFNQMMVWTGAAWMLAADTRIGEASGGVTNEANVRIKSDDVLAQSINTVWGFLGDGRALVQTGSEITLVPGAVKATQWTQVQAAVTDTSVNPPVVYKAAGEAKFTAYVTEADRVASSSYVLQVEAYGGDQKAVAGMILSSQVNKGVPMSACVFKVDSFAIMHPNLPSMAWWPFTVSDGVVKMNIAHISDHIQSDIFVPPGGNYQNTDYPQGRGWIIDHNGNAEFYGQTVMARILSNSTIIDKNSGYPISAVAQGCYQGALVDGRGEYHCSGNTRFYGPGRHGDNVPFEHRLRTTDNSVVVVASFIFTGAVDDPLSLWYRYNDGNWFKLAETRAEGNGYNPCSLAVSLPLGVGYWDYIDFAFSTRNQEYPDGHPSNNQVQAFSASVLISNL